MTRMTGSIPLAMRERGLWYFHVGQPLAQAVPSWGKGCHNFPSKPTSLYKAVLQKKKIRSWEWVPRKSPKIISHTAPE